jgi:hypothetical protein
MISRLEYVAGIIGTVYMDGIEDAVKWLPNTRHWKIEVDSR